MCFDHGDLLVVYLSQRDMTYSLVDMFEASTTNDGETWTIDTQVMDIGTTKDYCPAPVYNPTDDFWYMWLSEKFEDFTDYDTQVISTLEAEIMTEPAPLHRFELGTSRRVKLPDGIAGRIKRVE